jgi:4-diphosphocytidyl-2-C-methyl-D-erythritol kinase
MLTLTARAKINLFLDVFDKRSDGYHDIVSVMQCVTLADELVLAPSDSGPEVVYRNCPACDFHDDIILKAWQVLRDASGRDLNFSAQVSKRIPVAAGLGGGSADAAATLIGLNKLFGLGMSVAELTRLAATIGADVPFFMSEGTKQVEGAGEILRPAPPMPDCAVIIVKPAIDVSTARAYQDFDDYTGDASPARGGLSAILSAMAAGDYESFCSALHNSFEPAIFAKHPEVKMAKDAVLAAGADAALMSGSGSTVFALTRSPDVVSGIQTAGRRAGAAVFAVKPCNIPVVAVD